MRRALLLIFALAVLPYAHAQNDPEYYILNYGESKSSIISKGRSLLQDCLLEDDMEKVREIRKYLLDTFDGDNDYIVIYPVENWLLMYWTGEYGELLEGIQSFDYDKVIAESRTKIRPPGDTLLPMLKERSGSFEGKLKEQIKDAEFPAEEEDILLLNFDNMLYDVKKDIYFQDVLNTKADEFIAQYPDSKYIDFTRKHIKYKLVPSDWGIASELFSGYGIFTGELSDSYTNNIPLGVAFDICYRRIELYLRDYIGMNKTRRDMHYSMGTFSKGSPIRVFVFEASLGYALVDNDRFKVSPFAGIASTCITPTSKDLESIPRLDEVELGFTTTYVVGFNFDLKFGKKSGPAFIPKTNYGFVRIRYAYTMPQFEKKYSGTKGSMHYITVGIGGFSRRAKRDY